MNNDLLREAIKLDKIYSYLIGEGDYNLVNPYAETPTDPHKAFESIADYYFKDKTILEKFIKALVQMSLDPNFAWLSLYYFIAFARFNNRKDVGYDIRTLWNRIKKNVSLHEERLVFDKRWVGAMWPNGLWGDVLRMCSSIEEEIKK